MREYIESKGPKTLAPPVTSAELFDRVNENCGCYACRANQAAAERLLEIELKELEDHGTTPPTLRE